MILKDQKWINDTDPWKKSTQQLLTELQLYEETLVQKIQILTEIISMDKDVVVMKASGLIGGKVIATGHAEEKELHQE